jgi:hypothetical protein
MNIHLRNFSKLIIPNGVKSIGKKAFQTSNISNITIGTGVQEIGDDAFDCLLLESINVDKDNEHFQSIDGFLYNKEKTRLIACPKRFNNISLPKELEIISPNVFQFCRGEILVIPGLMSGKLEVK